MEVRQCLACVVRRSVIDSVSDLTVGGGHVKQVWRVLRSNVVDCKLPGGTTQ